MTVRNGIAKNNIFRLCILLILSVLVFAHGNQQHVMGEVAKIEATSITVKTTDGKTVLVMIVQETKFVKGGSPANWQDVKVGDRVVIHAKPEGGVLHATEVRMGNALKEIQR
jgi:hypothetical protein